MSIQEDDAMADPPSGVISFIEIGSADADAIRSFFGAVFGWSSHNDAWLQTPTIKAGTHGGDPTPQIYVYFHASDLEGAAQKVRAAGGEAADVVEEPGFGRFVNRRGPGGLQFGLHQSAG
jgi:predicted enzyme related to lactoylglutathione lyase